LLVKRLNDVDGKKNEFREELVKARKEEIKTKR